MRSYSSSLLASLAAALLFAGFAAPAQAQNNDASAPAASTPAAAPAPVSSGAGLKIALIDDQKLLADSKAAKSIEAQIDKKRDGYQKEFTSLEQQLRDKSGKLEASKDKMSPAEYDKQRAAFQNEVMTDQKLAQSRRTELEHAAADAVSKLRAQITKIVAGMADKNGYDLVLTRQNVVLAKDAMDITDQVLTQLDNTMTSVPMSFEGGESDHSAKTK
jgi:outer membrane protein